MKTEYFVIIVVVGAAILRLYARMIAFYLYKDAGARSGSPFAVAWRDWDSEQPHQPDVSMQSDLDDRRSEPSDRCDVSGDGDGVSGAQPVVCPRCGSVVEQENASAH